MNVEIISATEPFDRLLDEWSSLLADSAAESPFLTWEWLFSWWLHLRGTRTLAIVTVRENGRLVATVPFCSVRDRVAPFRKWELMGTGLAGSDYLDAIVRPGSELEAMQAIAAHMRTANVAIRLDHLPGNSFLGRLGRSLAESGWSVNESPDGKCPVIPLAGHTWDSFLATIGPANRATTRRRLRTLERRFSLRFSRIANASERMSALTSLFSFHEARFGSRGTAFHADAARRFHVDATARLDDAGILRLFTLHLGDQLAAVLYGMAFKGRFYFYQHGYDPQFQPLGVGRAILDLSIRAAIEEGLSEFDLLFGNEAYKSSWTSESRGLTRIELFPPHLAGRVHQHAVEAERSLRALARRVISPHASPAS